MRISTKGRYALRLMIDLAINHNGDYIPIKSIAVRQEISDKYLEQIISQLSRAGYVKSIRGSQGGYMLAKKPVEYTVGMILRLMEGDLSPVACLEDNNCTRYEKCVTVEVWKKIKEAVESVVDNITLEDLVKRQYEKNSLPIDFQI
ncbi:MAG: transcriptional regulator [Clostridia bacterium]|nr:transcriptional regulator [Clostridia bacterium]